MKTKIIFILFILLLIHSGCMSHEVPDRQTNEIKNSGIDYVAGKYEARIRVLKDEMDQAALLDLPQEMILQIYLDKNTLTITGPEPWIPVSGMIESKGKFYLDGQATYENSQSIMVKFSGRFESAAEGVCFGASYEVGVAGGLPGGLPIYYSIQAVKIR